MMLLFVDTFQISKTQVRHEHISPANDVDDDDVKRTIEMMEVAAQRLSVLDPRGYERDLLRDADAATTSIYLPMMIHWTHDRDRRIPNVQSYTYDIDEIPIIADADEDYDTNLTLSHQGPASLLASYDRLESLGHYRSVVTRCPNDPGVLLISTTTRVSLQQELDCLSTMYRSTQNRDNEDVAGELSLQLYERIQDSQQRRYATLNDNTHRRRISIRANTVSTRRSLFPLDHHDGWRPLHLLATLPTYVQDGQKLSIDEASAVARKLGSYDCREHTKETTTSSSPYGRVTSGRTRRIWTQKDDSHVLTARAPTWVSVLTGERIEKGAQKRPRHVRVLIRLDGAILESNRPGVANIQDAVTCHSKQIPYSERMITESCSLKGNFNARETKPETATSVTNSKSKRHDDTLSNSNSAMSSLRRETKVTDDALRRQHRVKPATGDASGGKDDTRKKYRREKVNSNVVENKQRNR
jgi:hypothetical protein